MYENLRAECTDENKVKMALVMEKMTKALTGVVYLLSTEYTSSHGALRLRVKSK